MSKTDNSFYEIMLEHPNEKLIDIVENLRAEYNEDALLAAEEVLRSRNISWEIKNGAAEEVQFENAQEEINYRLTQGESIEVIRNDLKGRGLNVFDYSEQEQEEEAKNNPEFAAKRKRMGLQIGAVVVLFMAS